MSNEAQQVVITDIKMPFFSMVWFMIKWVFAIIPALILIAVLILAAIIVNDMFDIVDMIKNMLPF
jgi:hypothetical protein